MWLKYGVVLRLSLSPVSGLISVAVLLGNGELERKLQLGVLISMTGEREGEREQWR